MHDGSKTNGLRSRAGIAALVVASMAGLGGGALLTRALTHEQKAPGEGTTEVWQCPMHPGVIQDHPGNCPLCGMKLVQVDKPAPAPPLDAVGGADLQTPAAAPLWQCPMHPGVAQDHPGNCPLCGMKLVQVDKPAPAPPLDAAGGAPIVPGLATVDIDPARRQLIGLRTAAVTKGRVGASWRTTGRVAVDETRVRRVNVKVGGYVERLYVDFVGRPVRRGEPLFSLYSPDLVSAQGEYLLALRTRSALARAGATGEDGENLVTSARRRLALWDVGDREIAELEQSGTPKKALILRAPASGVVTAKAIVEGARLSEGDTPYEITDLSVVWVLADVYETDLRRVHVGAPASFTAKAYPGRGFDGRVVFVDPLLDPATRTAKLRLELDNRDGELRPEMFGEVELGEREREALRVPADAVVPTGATSVVFVALGAGKLAPRRIELGARDDAFVEVVSGLAEGELVVTRANFLVDSESRLRAALARMGAE